MQARQSMNVSHRSTKMPTMLRIPGKAKKIAEKILGVPLGSKKKKVKNRSKQEQRLTFEETVRVR